MEGLQDGSLKLTALAKEHGFEVTAEEAFGLLDQANPETDGELELTDFEMSLVSGGWGLGHNGEYMAGGCNVKDMDASRRLNRGITYRLSFGGTRAC